MVRSCIVWNVKVTQGSLGELRSVGARRVPFGSVPVSRVSLGQVRQVSAGHAGLRLGFVGLIIAVMVIHGMASPGELRRCNVGNGSLGGVSHA